ncbi:hypothetical protein GTO91_03425 [Heliobacterium undosum]|uniref:Uncharacterized protein n=1 Tax=Heliomicrobium undosum TaxID=121734 RepID=A0A845L1B5_9FIRM|nr:hypothetical protein [Heliomicrobium undosum]MZP28759.1 hypothetical protein [Heliomicrobium undosum]
MGILRKAFLTISLAAISLLSVGCEPGDRWGEHSGHHSVLAAQMEKGTVPFHDVTRILILDSQELTRTDLTHQDEIIDFLQTYRRYNLRGWVPVYTTGCRYSITFYAGENGSLTVGLGGNRSLISDNTHYLAGDLQPNIDREIEMIQIVNKLYQSEPDAKIVDRVVNVKNGDVILAFSDESSRANVTVLSKYHGGSYVGLDVDNTFRFQEAPFIQWVEDNKFSIPLVREATGETVLFTISYAFEPGYQNYTIESN